MNVDVAIVGAGPAGLCCAVSLAQAGLSVAVLEQQPHAAIAEPAFDGREIALTHASRDVLMALGVWAHFAPEDISTLRDAHITNGHAGPGLHVRAADARTTQLGWLVPNQCIRRAAYAEASRYPSIALLAGSGVRAVTREAGHAGVVLDDGRSIRARLLVAADSRFSQVRRMLGIGARTHDHGMRMLVCRVGLEVPHRHVAWEWFDYGQTLALLPLNGDRASVVLTLPPAQMDQVMALDDAAFADEIGRRFHGRLGAVHTPGSRHVYPLVSVYADRFRATRAALVGDAAVGMHPVTAHGFNLGLQGQARLARLVARAHRRGDDIGADTLLARYHRGHQAAAWPLYTATGLVAGLYTDTRPAARLLRGATLRIASRLPPFRRAIAAHLTQSAG